MKDKVLAHKFYPMVNDLSRAKQVMAICNVEHDVALFALAANNEDQYAAVDFLMGDGYAPGRHPFVGVYAGPADTPSDADNELGNVGHMVCFLCR